MVIFSLAFASLLCRAITPPRGEWCLGVTPSLSWTRKDTSRPSAVSWGDGATYKTCSAVTFTIFDVSDSSINCCNLKKRNQLCYLFLSTSYFFTVKLVDVKILATASRNGRSCSSNHSTTLVAGKSDMDTTSLFSYLFNSDARRTNVFCKVQKKNMLVAYKVTFIYSLEPS